jgi:hypothetical protein
MSFGVGSVVVPEGKCLSPSDTEYNTSKWRLDIPASVEATELSVAADG